MTRRKKAAKIMADALIEWLHMMYQLDTARGVLLSLIEELTNRLSEFPVKEKNRRID